jgi:hypothetical protein
MLSGLAVVLVLAGTTATDAGAVDATDAGVAGPADAAAADAVASPAPLSPPLQQFDVASPPPPRAATRAAAPLVVERSPRHPGSGISISGGLAWGFTKDAYSGLRPGSGALVGLGAMITPIWSYNVGIGVGLDLDYKSNSADSSNGHFTAKSYPTIVRIHLMLGSGATFVLVRAGVEHDRDVSRNGRRAGLWGPNGSVGIYRRVFDHVAADASLVFSGASANSTYQPDSAASVGLTLALHLDL